MFKKFMKMLVYTILIAIIIVAIVVSYQYKTSTDGNTLNATIFALRNGLILILPLFIAGEIMEG